MLKIDRTTTLYSQWCAPLPAHPDFKLRIAFVSPRERTAIFRQCMVRQPGEFQQTVDMEKAKPLMAAASVLEVEGLTHEVCFEFDVPIEDPSFNGASPASTR